MAYQVQVKATVKLFFNLQDRSFYTQIGGKMFRISDKVATSIQEALSLEVRHANGIREMQELSLNDEK